MSDLGNEQQRTAEQVEDLEKEIILKNGEKIKLSSQKIPKMHLFFGSRSAGKTEVREADETTIGSGLYATSDESIARAYAMVRSSDTGKSRVYELEIRNLNILSLTSKDSIDDFAKLIKQELEDKKDKLKHPNEFIRQFMEERVDQTIEMIEQKKYRHLKDITFSFGDLVRTTLSGLGYDGLKAIEGGESGNGVTIGNHDTYVIFDPKNAKVIGEKPVGLITN